MNDLVFGRRYRVVEKIGSGGMADVYKATDEVLGRTVAVKVLHAQYASDQQFVARFRQEAQAAAHLSHPGIVNIFDWGHDEETYYIIMEYVRGTDLKTLVTERGPLDSLKAAEYGSQVCAALSVAHGYDVIHRDIKPHNIVLTPEGQIKVMDFGIARMGNTQMTQTGSVLGTAHYVSPEQAQGRKLGPASDLYSLGVVLYELTTGRLPFDGDSPVSVALKHVNEDPIPPRQINPNIPAAMEVVIMRAMSKDPSQRYASAEEMRRDLQRVASGRVVETQPAAGQTTVMPVVERDAMQSSRVRPVPRRSNPWPWIIGVVAVILVGIGVAWAMGAFDTAPDKIKVPDLTGMTVKQAEDALKAIQLTVGDIEPTFSQEESGTVVGQDPEEDAEVDAGAEIKLMVSAGLELFKVPKVVDLTEEEAAQKLIEAGFELAPAQREYNSKVNKGIVFKQTPEAGQKVPKGTRITLVVSEGTELREVPKVTGQSRSTAENDLTSAGFKVKVNEEYNDTVPESEVIRQSPDAGSFAEAGSSVTIVVSKGEELISVPEVRTETEADARTMIDDLGLNVVVNYQVTVNPDEDGSVLNQDPLPGTSVRRGDTVTIWVGKMPGP